MRIAVVALGKIGLPLAVQFASSGHDVIGVDVNQKAVDTINAGREPFPGEAHLQERLAELIPAGRLRATTDYAEAIPGAELVSEEPGQSPLAWQGSRLSKVIAGVAERV
jgi:UDP-N-acetyl-D-mannosaminuronate dehydrogenase